MLRKHFAACGFSLNPLHCGAVVASYCRFNSLSKPLICLNPLHCGAVVASWGPRAGEGRAAMSQSPSLRGSGRFRGRILDRKWCYHVSIPFIAGQWSLPGRATATPEPPTSLNPLHCGAVVASLVSLQRCKDMTLSLNPLHCGAVVASPWYRVPLSPPPESQSPSLRGSGRFITLPTVIDSHSWSQSPSLRGSGRFHGHHRGPHRPADRSQSPSLRGSGRFSFSASLRCCASSRSQSPSLRGSGRF